MTSKPVIVRPDVTRPAGEPVEHGRAWFETYSVLTRLPAGRRRSPGDAVRLLRRNFPEPGFLGEAEALALGSELARLGVAGGWIDEALVGAAARQHKSTLVSGDPRARPVYEALGVEVEVPEL